MAELCLFPPTVIAQAREIVQRVKVREMLGLQPSIENEKSRVIRKLATTLVQVARNSQLDLPSLRYFRSFFLYS